MADASTPRDDDTEPLSPGMSAGERVDAANALTGSLMERLGLEFLEVGPARVVARIPVEGNTQPFGLLHGGATAALCETVASLGTGLIAGPGRIVVGIELNVNHLRRVESGHVTATGVPIHLGRTTAVWDMRVHDDEGRLVAVSRLTLAVREPAPS